MVIMFMPWLVPETIKDIRNIQLQAQEDRFLHTLTAQSTQLLQFIAST